MAASVLVPASLSVLGSVFSQSLEPEKMIEQLLVQISSATTPVADLPQNPDDPSLDVLGTLMRQSQLYYIIGYFGLIYGSLVSLMIYNLVKMFGWDKDIDQFQNETLSWFMTPPKPTDGGDEGAEEGDEEGGDEAAADGDAVE